MCTVFDARRVAAPLAVERLLVIEDEDDVATATDVLNGESAPFVGDGAIGHRRVGSIQQLYVRVGNGGVLAVFDATRDDRLLGGRDGVLRCHARAFDRSIETLDYEM